MSTEPTSFDVRPNRELLTDDVTGHLNSETLFWSHKWSWSATARPVLLLKCNPQSDFIRVQTAHFVPVSPSNGVFVRSSVCVWAYLCCYLTTKRKTQLKTWLQTAATAGQEVNLPLPRDCFHISAVVANFNETENGRDCSSPCDRLTSSKNELGNEFQCLDHLHTFQRLWAMPFFIDALHLLHLICKLKASESSGSQQVLHYHLNTWRQSFVKCRIVGQHTGFHMRDLDLIVCSQWGCEKKRA